MCRKNRNFIRCLIVTTLWVSSIPSRIFGAPSPTVYSGSVHIDRLSRDVRFRLFFLQQPRLGQVTPVTAVFGMLYFGDDGTHEYVSLYYDQAIVNQPQKEVMLFRDDDARSRRIPTMRLKFNEDDTVITGTMVSQTESVVGNLILKNGWDFGPGEYLDEIGGIYDASQCERKDGAALKFEEVEILPSRLHQEKLVPEGMFGETNFVGNGLCKRLGHVSCVSFTSGSYNFIRGRLDLHHGVSDWLCQRDDTDEISCESPVINKCTLTRQRKILAPTLTAKTNVLSERFVWKLPVPTTRSQDCLKWEGDFRGLLTHRLAARKQHVEVRLNSFPSGVADGVTKCVITGSAKLYFANRTGRQSVLNFPIINVEMNAHNESMILHSDAYTDLALHLDINDDGLMTGGWYSRLFGYVGDFQAERDSKLWPEINTASAVFSYEGLYTQREKPIYQFDLRAIESGFDKSSHDPFVQLKIQGSLFYGGGLPESNEAISWDTFTTSSYDYFTNFFVMKGGATYSGYIDEVGMHLRGSSNRYLSIVGHALDKVIDYDRN